MPRFQGLYTELHSKGLEAIGLTLDGVANGAPRYFTRSGYTFAGATVRGPATLANPLFRAYGVRTLPTTVVIDHEGNVAYASYDTDYAELRQVLAALGVR